MLPIVLLIIVNQLPKTGSTPCQLLSDTQLRCRQTPFTVKSLPTDRNLSSLTREIIQVEWIESGRFIYTENLFDKFSNVKNVSIRSNSLISLSNLPFWSSLFRIEHLDLSQNRLSSLNEHDFRSFENLVSLNISSNLLNNVEPIWLSIRLSSIDLSHNGINSIGFVHVQNSTNSLNSICFLREMFLNRNRGLLSFSQIDSSIISPCLLLTKFELIENFWHCGCNELINGLKHYRSLKLNEDSGVALSGSCQTPSNVRSLEIEKISEELVCQRFVIFDSSTSDDENVSSSIFPRYFMTFFILACSIGLLLGICLNYCFRRSHDLIVYLLFRCDRRKISNHPSVEENFSISEPRISSNFRRDSLPSYNQAISEIFYVDLHSRPTNRTSTDGDGEC